MGYMEISIGGSDMAHEAYALTRNDFIKAANKALKFLRRELKDPGNLYNTGGPVNVAMVVTETKIPMLFASEYPAFMQETIDALVEYIADSAEGEWGTSAASVANKKMHMDRYRALLKKLRRMQAKIDPAEYEELGDYWTEPKK